MAKIKYHMLVCGGTGCQASKSEEILNLKTKVQELECENADLKKKYLLRLMTQN